MFHSYEKLIFRSVTEQLGGDHLSIIIPSRPMQDDAEASKRAVVTNKGVPRASGGRRTAFFDIKQAGDAAGDWIKTVSKVGTCILTYPASAALKPGHFTALERAGRQCHMQQGMAVLQDLERRFGKVDLVKIDGGADAVESPFKELGRNLKQIHPLRAMNSQVKVCQSDLTSLPSA